MIILIHTSKTMKAKPGVTEVTQPLLAQQAYELALYIKTLSPETLAQVMKISPKLASITYEVYKNWSTTTEQLSSAVDIFLGDIYSGLQAQKWSQADRTYAQKHLRILSGLYGILRPLDAICPYRLEMAYKLPDKPYKNLYDYWGDRIANTLPKTGTIINLAAVEYSKTVLPYVDTKRVITPRFLSVNPKTNEPTFVVVHAKIARGAFANWLITNRVHDESQLNDFTDIGYKYEAQLSSPQEPVFVCQEFEGKGLSIRLA